MPASTACVASKIVRTFISGSTHVATLRRILGAGLVYVLLRPILGFGHELVVAAIAHLLRFLVGTSAWEPLIRLLGLDPIYAGAAIRAAGGVEVTGFAVAGPVGQLLHLALPFAFMSPRQVVDGAGVSMVAAAGAPALGRGLAAFGGDVVWLAIGVWLCWPWRRVDWRLAVIGVFIQAQIVVNHLLGAQVSVPDLDASGLPFALQVASADHAWLTDGLRGTSPPWQDVAVGATLVVLGYAGALAVVALAHAIALVARVRWRRAPRQDRPVPHVRYALRALTASLALAAAWSPVGALAVGQSNWQLATATMLTPRQARAVIGLPRHLRLAGPTPVHVTQTGGAWQYRVDGISEPIRGVGYNPQYAALPDAERASLYTRDFSDMRAAGINTIEGWFEGQFDSVTLDAAARNGMGVLMPFEVNQDWPIENPNVQQSILDHVSAYVERYKDHPAVRMWAPGNENMHRILFPRWVSQENEPTAHARADAFAAFLPRLADRIHELDPNHPVVYRDAEDVYLSRIVSAFDQSGVQRPWLVYGANVYSTPRLQQIIANWPKQWPGHALLISEYAPGGVGPAERPLAFQQQWSVIRSRPDVVLGGMAYTWATNGPEDLDRVFGLVDAAGVPTDGALSAIANAYLADASASELTARSQP